MDYSVVASALFASRALLVGALHVVIAGAVTAHVLMTKRDVPAAIGWIGMAWLAPVLGALLYVGFGINRVKRRARRLKGPVRSVDPLRSRATWLRTIRSNASRAAIGKITGHDMAAGKVVAILDCGDQAYPQMLAAIESAKSHVRLSTYIFRTDELGLKFIEALARAHRRGVTIRVLIDGFGGGLLALFRLSSPCAARAFPPPASCIRPCRGRCRFSICACTRRVSSSTGGRPSSAASISGPRT